MQSEDLIQGSQEWLDYRCGRVTASGIVALMAKSSTTGNWLASRANYMAEKVAERFTKTPAASYVNDAMRWGLEKEPDARRVYSLLLDVDVKEVGFVNHPTIPLSGCSPDGLVSDDGLIEIKCPYTATHIETLLTQKIDHKYIVQMQWQMACADRLWCDYVSFDPRLEPRMQLFVKRVRRDMNMIEDMEKHVIQFLYELDDVMAKLNTLYPYPEEAVAA